MVDIEGHSNIYIYLQGYLISQSGDAQCTLHSAKEGDKTMTLKKVSSHDQQCSLPHWMLQHHHTFHNLGMFSHKMSIMTIFGLNHFYQIFITKFDFFSHKNWNGL